MAKPPPGDMIIGRTENTADGQMLTMIGRMKEWRKRCAKRRWFLGHPVAWAIVILCTVLLLWIWEEPHAAERRQPRPTVPPQPEQHETPAPDELELLRQFLPPAQSTPESIAKSGE